MAGVKGRSGGARAGAGRPKKEMPPIEPVDPALAGDMLQLLQNVALGLVPASNIQVRAAIAAVQYTHTKKGDGGKKEEAAEKAKKAATSGRFAAAKPPNVIALNAAKRGKKDSPS